jgi:dGTPase
MAGPTEGVRTRRAADLADQDAARNPGDKEHAGRQPSERSRKWVATMHGSEHDGITLAHAGSPPPPVGRRVVSRNAREEAERRILVAGATRSSGAGNRARPEEPDPLRTCFERDRDRILHSTAFRRLAGKTQVFVFPADHQRTRLTHALEVAQVATAMARGIGLNVALAEAIALGHDCGHGPGGHASEDAFDRFVPGGYHHAVWGADIVLEPLNLCRETLDGIRNHSWSRPTPCTPEGVVVSWADRCAYSAHDLEDAVRAGIVTTDDLPTDVTDVVGRTRSEQLHAFIAALVDCTTGTGTVGMHRREAEALASLRAFNYERIYNRSASVAQAEAVIEVLDALVGYFSDDPARLPEGPGSDVDPMRAAVTYVAGVTDRFAFDTATSRLGWQSDRLPRGIDAPGPAF